MEGTNVSYRLESSTLRFRPTTIALIDPLDIRRKHAEAEARTAGYEVQFCGSNLESLWRGAAVERPTLVFVAVDVRCETAWEQVERLRDEGYGGLLALHNCAVSLGELERALGCGADYFARNARFAFSQAISCVLRARGVSAEGDYRPCALLDCVLLQSLGLTRHELELLCLFADSFEEQVVLADRLYTSPSAVHKTFSRIVAKLGPPLGVENVAGLSHLLTRLLLRR